MFSQEEEEEDEDESSIPDIDRELWRKCFHEEEALAREGAEDIIQHKVQDSTKLIMTAVRQYRAWYYCLKGMWFYMTLRRVISLIIYYRALSFSIPTDCLSVIDMMFIAVERYLLYRYTNCFIGLTPLWLGNLSFSLARYKPVRVR